MASRLKFSPDNFKKLFRDNPELAIDHSVNQYTPLNEEEKKTKNRHKAVSKIEAGLLFDSTLEAKRYRVLKEWQRAGIITNLSTQHVDQGKGEKQSRPHWWLLSPKWRDEKGKIIRAQYYVDDFQYCIDGIEIVEDIKGYPERVFLNKMKILLDKYPHINFFLNYKVDGWYPSLYNERWSKLCQK